MHKAEKKIMECVIRPTIRCWSILASTCVDLSKKDEYTMITGKYYWQKITIVRNTHGPCVVGFPVS